MTVQPTANRDEVLYRGGPFGGHEHNFKHSKPDSVVHDETGDGSVANTKFGARVRGGGTSGTAGVNTGGYESSLPVMRIEGIWRTPSTWPPNDDFKVGAATSIDPADTGGVYFDLSSEQVVVSGTTGAMPSAANGPESQYFAIEVDNVAGETTFTVASDGGKDSTTVAATPTWIHDYLITVSGNGNNEAMSVQYARLVIPEPEP